MAPLPSVLPQRAQNDSSIVMPSGPDSTSQNLMRRLESRGGLFSEGLSLLGGVGDFEPVSFLAPVFEDDT